MKNLTLKFIIIFLGCSISTNIYAQKSVKRYSIKSGKIIYTSKISSNILGCKSEGKGKEIVHFKNWGRWEVIEEKSIQKMNINVFGVKKTEEEKTHTKEILKDNISYSVDYLNKEISEHKDMLLSSLAENGKNMTAEEFGRQTLESMGGKVVGKENIKGYQCEVWEMPIGKQWIYKGIVLKVESKKMGVTMIKEAISVEFNCHVSNSVFNLPDFPRTKEEQIFE